MIGWFGSTEVRGSGVGEVASSSYTFVVGPVARWRPRCTRVDGGFLRRPTPHRLVSACRSEDRRLLDERERAIELHLDIFSCRILFCWCWALHSRWIVTALRCHAVQPGSAERVVDVRRRVRRVVVYQYDGLRLMNEREVIANTTRRVTRHTARPQREGAKMRQRPKTTLPPHNSITVTVTVIHGRGC